MRTWPNTRTLAGVSTRPACGGRVELGVWPSGKPDSHFYCGWPAAFSPDNSVVASVSKIAGQINLQNPRGEIVREISKAAGRFTTSLSFSPDGRTLAVGDVKGFVTLWRIK